MTSMSGEQMAYLLDASAWIEHFMGSEKGRIVKRLLDDKRAEIITADSTVAEIFEWAMRNGHDFVILLQIVKKRSRIQEICLNLWLEAAKRKQEAREDGRKGFGLMDALLLAVQDATGATLVTGDAHFTGLKNVKML